MADEAKVKDEGIEGEEVKHKKGKLLTEEEGKDFVVKAWFYISDKEPDKANGKTNLRQKGQKSITHSNYMLFLDLRGAFRGLQLISTVEKYSDMAGTIASIIATTIRKAPFYEDWKSSPVKVGWRSEPSLETSLEEIVAFLEGVKCGADLEKGLHFLTRWGHEAVISADTSAGSIRRCKILLTDNNSNENSNEKETKDEGEACRGDGGCKEELIKHRLKSNVGKVYFMERPPRRCRLGRLIRDFDKFKTALQQL